MVEEELEVNGTSSKGEGNPKSSGDRAKRLKKKKKKQLKESVNEEEGAGGDGSSGKKVESGRKKKKKRTLMHTATGEEGRKNSMDSVEKGKKKRRRSLLEETAVTEEDEEDNMVGGSLNERNPMAESEEEEQLFGDMSEEEPLIEELSPLEEEHPEFDEKRAEILKNKMKKQLLKAAAKADKRGVCYLSRIPPHMDYGTLRHILSNYGEIQRIYLAPADAASQGHRKRESRARKFNFQQFSEGWVEFTNKNVAKRVAKMLNGEQIGGRKRSQFYYDLWNIKYLSKFKWDDLTEEIAYKKAAREQKLALELSAAKRERDFYLTKVEQARAITEIEERRKKKQNLGRDSGTQTSVDQQMPKVKRKIPQTKPVADKAEQSKSRLSKDILAEIFGGS